RRLARRRGLSGRGFLFGGGHVRGDDLHDRVVVGEKVTADHALDLAGGDGEVAFEFGVDDVWVAVVERELGESLRAVERRLSVAHGVVQKRVAKLLHLVGRGAFRCETFYLLLNRRANRAGRVARLRDGVDVQSRRAAALADP